MKKSNLTVHFLFIGRSQTIVYRDVHTVDLICLCLSANVKFAVCSRRHITDALLQTPQYPSVQFLFYCLCKTIFGAVATAALLVLACSSY